MIDGNNHTATYSCIVCGTNMDILDPLSYDKEYKYNISDTRQKQNKKPQRNAWLFAEEACSDCEKRNGQLMPEDICYAATTTPSGAVCMKKVEGDAYLVLNRKELDETFGPGWVKMKKRAFIDVSMDRLLEVFVGSTVK